MQEIKSFKDDIKSGRSTITGHQPVVSVIMPVYNGEKYLQEAIQSILSQTYKDFEFIIIDDGSTDNTVSILHSCKSVDNRIFIIPNEKNKGNYPCRNQGINIARGKYIAVMDADDIAFPERLQTQYDYMEKNPDIVASGSDFTFCGELPDKGQRGKDMTYEQICTGLMVNNCLLHPSLIVRSDVLKELGGYNECYVYSADYDLICRLALRGRIVNMSDILMQYRWHPTQISQKHWTEQQRYADGIRKAYQNSVKKLMPLGKTEQNGDRIVQSLTIEKRQDFLLRIARHLILHSSFCPNSGLLKGKMGIAIFFYELFKVTGQKVYNDYAGDLIDEIYEKMNHYTSLFFNDGLAGIGWGFEYIIRKKYVDADDILENLDKQMMERNVRVITDTGLDRGLKGIAYYVIARCANREKHAIHDDFIIGLLESLHICIRLEDLEGQFLAAQLVAVIKQQNIEQDGMILLSKIIQNSRVEAAFVYDRNRPLGILNNGYTELGLKILWS